MLLVLLLATDIFRSDLAVSRWRDPVWLAWLAPAAYMLHQTEEYGIDLLGQTFAFPNQVCTTFGQLPYPDCNVPPSVFVAINIPVIWITGLIGGLLFRRHPLFGLAIYGVAFVNSLSHIGMFAATGAYNPGLLTAFLILLPVSIWAGYAMARDSRIGKAGIGGHLAVGVVVNGLLLLCLAAFSRGLLPGGALITIQALNPVWCLLLPWLKERRDANASHAAVR